MSSSFLSTWKNKIELTIFFVFQTEIYRIVSQKQMRDPPEGDTIRPQNVEPINVKPTMNSDGMRKQCCQWLDSLFYKWVNQARRFPYFSHRIHIRYTTVSSCEFRTGISRLLLLRLSRRNRRRDIMDMKWLTPEVCIRRAWVITRVGWRLVVWSTVVLFYRAVCTVSYFLSGSRSFCVYVIIWLLKHNCIYLQPRLRYRIF